MIPLTIATNELDDIRASINNYIDYCIYDEVTPAWLNIKLGLAKSML